MFSVLEMQNKAQTIHINIVGYYGYPETNEKISAFSSFIVWGAFLTRCVLQFELSASWGSVGCVCVSFNFGI